MKKIVQISLASFLLIFSLTLQAETNGDQKEEKLESAKIVKISGDEKVTVVQTDAKSSRQATVDSLLYAGEKIVTKTDQSVAFILFDKTRVTVGPSSSFLIEKTVFTHKSEHIFLKLFYGVVETWVKKISNSDSEFVISTPSAAMGVRGTHFIVEHESSSEATSVHTFEGIVAMAKDSNSLRGASSFVRIQGGQTSRILPDMKTPPPPQSFSSKPFLKQFRTRVPIETTKIKIPRETPGGISSFFSRKIQPTNTQQHPGLPRNSTEEKKKQLTREERSNIRGSRLTRDDIENTKRDIRQQMRNAERPTSNQMLPQNRFGTMGLNPGPNTKFTKPLPAKGGPPPGAPHPPGAPPPPPPGH